MPHRERFPLTDEPRGSAVPFVVAPLSTRRAVLRTAGLLAAAGGGASVLAACSAGAETPPAAAPSSAPPATSSPPSASASPSASPSPSASKSASASAATSAPAPSGPSVSTADVPVGGGVVLEDADYVITQPTKGTFKAFSSKCTHAGCKVAEVDGGTILCRCHGSQFSIEDGSVTNPPASKALAETATTVSGDSVYVDD